MISKEIVNTCDFGSGSANNESQNEEDRGHDVVVVCYTEDKKKKFGLKRERERVELVTGGKLAPSLNTNPPLLAALERKEKKNTLRWFFVLPSSLYFQKKCCTAVRMSSGRSPSPILFLFVFSVAAVRLSFSIFFPIVIGRRRRNFPLDIRRWTDTAPFGCLPISICRPYLIFFFY